MLWIVRIALDKPYTFVVLALLILIIGPLSILRTPVDIFPNIKMPVVSVVWTYNGLPANDVSDRIITYFERQMTTAVNDIEHIESQSLPGVGVIKVFFQPSVNINAALAQVTAIAQTVLKRLPPGITPPQILSYNASSVPILQLALSSNKLSDQQLYDLSNNFIRPQLAQVEGAAIPSPYGGKARQVQIDLDPEALRAHGLSPLDVTTAIAAQNLILPSGTEKIGRFEYNVKLNSSPHDLDDLNNLPIKSVDGTTIYIRDVAHVRDGYSPQTNMVRVDGKHSVLTTIQKNGNASTLDIISHVKKLLPTIQAGAPPELDMKAINDQSVFVKNSVAGVIREGVIAAALTALMILLFLGSWRSTLIITVSIPLAILASIITLSALGETINIMTLGGLALAVGILVDDATVTIENINWHLEQGKDVVSAIMDGAAQIVGPALISLLCICIVFVPMFFLNGVARFLFVPMAEAVVFAMIASFVLSRTLVPTMAKYLLHEHSLAHPHASGHLEYVMDDHGAHSVTLHSRNPFARFQQGFEKRVASVRATYRDLLQLALARRGMFVLGFLAVVAASFLLAPWLGENFFPTIDAGQIKLHVRAQTGTRIEETARLCDEIEQKIRGIIPPSDLGGVIDNIGLPVSGINISYSNSAPIGPADADILISLKPDHAPTEEYLHDLRETLPSAFPGTSFAFLPADIVSQILNFGLPAPIDVQVIGFKRDENRAYAAKILDRINHIPGIADVRIQQVFNQPVLNVNVDRTRSEELGLTQRDVATSLLVSLSGSYQTAPTQWVNPKNHVSYPLVAQTPQYRISSLSDLQNIPVTGAASSKPQILGALGNVTRGMSEGVVSHYDVQPVIDIFGAVQGRDLGAVARDIQAILDDTQKDVPKGSTVALRGQVETMNASFDGLFYGLIGAIVLIYLLIVVNFQSWLDPFVIITALPAALAGIVWMLFITHTTLSVPALTGAIMCMGVATANSILIVSFARERMTHGSDATTAAIEAGFTRFRPVLMTALAMIIGMLPMALGLGEGGEQNAPLGRAVIGGLLFATCATLFFVPAIFSIVHTRGVKRESDPSSSPVMGQTSFAE
ncbi:efflux RND transporter permease subunit [Pseudolysobacter antarcticus]|uniref:Efflux RND transporter permease subunit n=1 Tax=Pseudolysobacter antarcticus TaxID=2511995 RepID=A0A411HM10_9GAMM|nr:efflux RND transporter permease subunit [Pseudolysobacter antarcticus]QBB71430.1 efflux RND transporter permease subunit [Pseudolysobacter antarcticus]